MFVNYKDFYTDLLLEFTEELMPEIFKHLRNEKDPMVGVHFSRGFVKRDKIGNPIKIGKDIKREPHLITKKPHWEFDGETNKKTSKFDSSHGDPVGIYVFPKHYILSGGLKRNGGFAKYEYFYIIKPNRSKCKILNLSTISDSEVSEILTKMEIPEEYQNIDNKEIYKYGINFDKPGEKLWQILKSFLRKHGTDSYAWNKLFKKAGYNCIVDEGDDIIYNGEPEQIIYLEPNSYEIVYSNENKNIMSVIISKIFQSFPELDKRNGIQWGERRYLLSLKSNPKFQIVLQTSLDIIYLKIYGTAEGNKEYRFNINDDVDGKVFEIENIINIIKQSLNNIKQNDYKSSEREKISTQFLSELSMVYNLRLKKDRNDELYFRRNGYDKSTDSPVNLTIYFYDNPTIQIERKKSYGWRNYFYQYSDKEITLENYKDYGIEKTISKLLDGLENYIKNYKSHNDTTELYKKEGALKFVKIIRDKIFLRRNGKIVKNEI